MYSYTYCTATYITVYTAAYITVQHCYCAVSIRTYVHYYAVGRMVGEVMEWGKWMCHILASWAQSVLRWNLPKVTTTTNNTPSPTHFPCPYFCSFFSLVSNEQSRTFRACTPRVIYALPSLSPPARGILTGDHWRQCACLDPLSWPLYCTTSFARDKHTRLIFSESDWVSNLICSPCA